jgi:glutamyl-tRNA synthetase
LHLGSLRTALAAWLLARSAGGSFLLRFEDIDPDRSRASWEAAQLGALAGLGLDWDGPVVRQSERLELYNEALLELELLGLVYPCFCTRAEIRAAASAPHGPDDLPEGAYLRTCRHLGSTQRARRLAAGERHSLRFDAGAAHVTFTDTLAGPRSCAVDDFVLRRSDGVFAYQLAVVVDDFRQGVTQVVRGADLLDSVGRQVLLMRALGYPEPTWAHVPLVLGPDGRRLAKRHGSRERSQSPTQTLALLARSLGLSLEGGEEASAPASAADLLGRFDPASIPAGPVTF